jgi:hypothetical protein
MDIFFTGKDLIMKYVQDQAEFGAAIRKALAAQEVLDTIKKGNIPQGKCPCEWGFPEAERLCFLYPDLNDYGAKFLPHYKGNIPEYVRHSTLQNARCSQCWRNAFNQRVNFNQR